MGQKQNQSMLEKVYLHLLRSRWTKVASVLASVVVFCTVYALILPAITLSSQTTRCGYEEHTHTAECYDAENNLVCGLEEHTHTLACYSDPNADVEGWDVWTADIPELTGDPRADIVAIAASQVGYKESDKNYLVSNENQTQGYTRYGHWYGDVIDGSGERLANGLSEYAYADWDAIFASFVLEQAGVRELGSDIDAGNWAGALGASGHYADAADYTPQAGDLIFFTPEAGAKVNVGIITDVNKGFFGLFGNTIHSFSVIAGNSDNSVQEIKVAVDSRKDGDVTFETIHGYGIIPSEENKTDYSVNEEIKGSPADADQSVPADEATAEQAAAEAAQPEQAAATEEGNTEAATTEQIVIPADESTAGQSAAPADESTAGLIMVPTDEIMAGANVAPADESTAEQLVVPADESTAGQNAVPVDESVTGQPVVPADESTAGQFVVPTDESMAEQAGADNSGVTDQETVPADVTTAEEAIIAAQEAEGQTESVVPGLAEDTNRIVGKSEKDLESAEVTEKDGVTVSVAEHHHTDDGSALIMNWKAETQLEEGVLPAGAIIRVDTATGKSHGLTAAQVKSWGGVAVICGEATALVDNDNYEITFIGDNGNLYTWADVQGMSEESVVTFTGIHVKVLNDVKAAGENDSVELAFETTAKIADANAGMNYYVTRVSVNGKTGSETFSYKNGEAVPVDQDKVLQDAGLVNDANVKILTVKKSDYIVTMSYGPKAGIPEGSKLYVKEIRKGTEEFNTYIEDAKAALGINGAAEAELQGRFFDIKIMTKDGEFEPKAPVNVNIEYREAIETQDASNVSAVHFSKDGAESIPVDATDISAAQDDMAKVKAVEFSAESFSVYGVVYTVDFEYTDPVTGEVYRFTMGGGESINLTELLVILGIKAEDEAEQFVAEEVEDVSFSNPELVRVTRTGKFLGMFGKADWKLESLEPFDTEETLEISLKNAVKITVKVTDDNSEVAANDGIKALLTDATITGATQSGNGYILYKGQPYGIKLSFKEENKMNGQFPMSNSFYYKLPDGLRPEARNGTFPIVLQGGEHAGETVNLNYTFSSTGVITFTWDTTTNPGAFNQLKNSLYTSFNVEIDCTYNGSSGHLDFGNDIVKDVEVRDKGHVTLRKTGKYNAATNCMDYFVTVTSEGICNNVVVSDTVSGTALTYKKDATASSSIYGKPVPSPNSHDNGFTLTIPKMNDGETVTVKYSAAVALDQLTQDSGSWGTLSQTGNTATVTNNGEPEGNVTISGKDFENKISMSDISKSGTALETDASGHAKVNWTIKANTNANVSMAGHTISDSIDGNSVPMTYYGEGIYVTAYYENGSPAYTNRLIKWNEMTSNNTSWSWRVPNSYPDNQKLSYVISYDTDVDVSSRLIETEVKNTTTSDNGGSDTGTAGVKPYGGGVTGRKKVVKTDLAANVITWEVSFDVPATGLDSAKIVDTVPTYYDYNNTLVAVDNYIDGTVTVTPELDTTESYTVTPSTDGDGKEYLTIEFFKTSNGQTVTGLTGTGAKRRIRVQFQTEIDGTWKQAAINNPGDNNAVTHTNNVDIIVNNQTIEKSASTRIDGTEPGMNKVHFKQTTWNINGNSLPTYPFVLTLQGITDDNFDENGYLTITDTFNSKYLAYYTESQNNNTGDNDLVGRVFGANSYHATDPIHNSTKLTENRVITVPANEEGKIEITLNREDLTDDNGAFYKYYYIYYYLTIKDPLALEKLQKAIQTSESGVYNFLNTATNKDFGAVTDEFEYKLNVVDKEIVKHGDKNAYFENGNYMVDFKIDVNPGALELGDEEELSLTDDYENLAIDYTTIKIQKKVGEQWVDTTAADGVSWDRKGHRVTYHLKNGVHYRITYSARIYGETTASDTNVTYSNSVKFFGVEDNVKETQNISSSGGGQSIVYGIQVYKHVKREGSTPLSGAKFKLYKYTPTENDRDGWQNRPTATTAANQTGWEEVKRNGNPLTLVTGTDGVASTVEADQIQRHTWYKLVEIEAPQGYQKKDIAYVFWITDTGKADYDHYVYLNDDVVAIDNEPVLPDEVTIGVEKTWSNDNDDITKRRDITVRLYADGVPYDTWRDNNGQPLPARTDTVKVLPLKVDGTMDRAEWTGLKPGPAYSVVEDSVPGYTTTYSPRSTQTGGTIYITNKYVPDKTFIHVEKNWSDKLDPNAIAEDITVQLKRKVMPNATIQFIRYDGLYYYSTTIAPGSKVNISYKEKNSNNSRGYTVYEGQGITGRILAQRSTSYGGLDGSVLIPNITVPSQGITIQFPNDGFDWNNLTGDPIIDVVTPPAGLSYIEDTNFNNENRYYTLNADNNWKIDIDRLVKEDDDGKYIYYIEEVGVNDNTETPDDAGYKVTYDENNGGIAGGTGNDAQDTIKVSNAPQTVDVEFEKNWVNTETTGAASGFVNDTSKLRIVIQLERWYLDDNGEEQKVDDLYDPITLYGDTTTYADQGYPENYDETTDPANGNNWSAKFTEVPKKGQVNGKTVEYIYKIVEKRAYLTDSIDPENNDLIKLGIVNSSVESSNQSTTATNTFPETTLSVEKKWVDSENNPITPPPGVTVTVQLQRRQRDVSGNYDYSGDITPGEWSEYSNVTGKTLTLQNGTWTGSFSHLPIYGWHKDESSENKFSFLEFEYRVVEASVTINNEPADKHYTSAVEMEDVGQTDKKATITNTEVETTSYEVTKIWKDAEYNNVDWVKDITITLHKKADSDTTYTYTYTVSEVTESGGSKSYVATSEQAGAPAATVTGNAADGYTIKWAKLDIGFEYWTTEDTVEEYKDPIYAVKVAENEFKETDNENNPLTKAGDKGYIINQPMEAVSLPHTGGIGTHPYRTAGIMMVVTALLGVFLVKRRENRNGG